MINNVIIKVLEFFAGGSEEVVGSQKIAETAHLLGDIIFILLVIIVVVSVVFCSFFAKFLIKESKDCLKSLLNFEIKGIKIQKSESFSSFLKKINKTEKNYYRHIGENLGFHKNQGRNFFRRKGGLR